ncbi:MAG: LysR family transcriptional regulator [Erysipelotrichaceae bacterium]|nr:LysR family transcriptional regulator [Erysipelotrichaceae bacterium]
MTQEMINTFLNVYKYGNMTSAAANTFTTQSNMSKQIKLLEEELGVTLLIRKKGHASITLTPHGEAFLKLAQDYQSLMKEFEQIKNINDLTDISIGALDRMNTFTLVNYYRYALKAHPQIRLDTHTRHTREIYALMESNQLDLGFVTAFLPVNNVKITPLFEEDMCVVTSKDTDLGEIISPDELDPSLEIYSRWSDEFEIWHEQYWPGRDYRMHLGTASMAPDYLSEKGRWTIMPVGTLQTLLSSYELSFHHLNVDTPKTTVYLLESKNPHPNRIDLINTIKQEMIDYLQTNTLLRMLK